MTLCSSLVEIPPDFNYGAYNFRLRRSVLEVVDEGSFETEYEETPELIASQRCFYDDGYMEINLLKSVNDY